MTRYLSLYKKNLSELQHQLVELENARYDLERNFEEAARNGHEVHPNVQTWLNSANEILREGENIYSEKETRKYSYLCGWWPNMKSRYFLSQRAGKVALDADKLAAQLKPFPGNTSSSPSAATSNANEVTDASKLESSCINEVLDRLKDHRISIIGMYGDGGRGIKSVAIQVRKRAKAEKTFDEVVLVNVVSPHPNLYKIQGDLGKMLGLQFEGESLSERGRRVHENLLLKRRVLVIFDDVKEKFELPNVGINQCDNKGCKVVVIASSENVCSEMGTQRNINIPIQLICDGWLNFKIKAGDWVKGQNCIAKEIVDECGHYPVAINKLSEEMNKWINKVERSTGISVPDAQEVNRRRLRLFGGAQQA